MHLGADEEVEAGRLVPARMINELAFCERLFHLEWVQGEFVDNALTIEGKDVHRRVDGRGGALPEPGEGRPFESRSVSLSSERLGLSAKIDLVEGEGGEVIPVDYKRGKPPDNEHRAHEPERVQLCAYGLLLKEHGYRCDRGILYFAAARTRVEVPFDEALIRRTLELIERARVVAASPQLPPPLKGSPKCQGCSLNVLCLPDEVNHLSADASAPVRPFVPARDDAAPLYVQEQGARVGLSGEVLTVRGRDGALLAEMPLLELSQLVLIGNVQVSSQAVRELSARDIAICWLTFGGWLAAIADGFGHGNVQLRQAQYRAADDYARSLVLARRIVRAKIANCRTLLRRNHPDGPERALRELAHEIERADAAESIDELLGIEGNAARIYFAELPRLLRAPESSMAFVFFLRIRRPPRDPVNAMLSMAYALLAKDFAAAARAVGFDPYLGFYHRPRFGRPALALDLMEEFRPIVCDSVVLSAVNTGALTERDFIRNGLGVAMTPDGRKRFLRAYERRLQEEVTHPVFGYRVSYRRVLEVQCRLLARHLMGEIPEYPEFRTR